MLAAEPNPSAIWPLDALMTECQHPPELVVDPRVRRLDVGALRQVERVAENLNGIGVRLRSLRRGHHDLELIRSGDEVERVAGDSRRGGPAIDGDRGVRILRRGGHRGGCRRGVDRGRVGPVVVGILEVPVERCCGDAELGQSWAADDREGGRQSIRVVSRAIDRPDLRREHAGGHRRDLDQSGQRSRGSGQGARYRDVHARAVAYLDVHAGDVGLRIRVVNSRGDRPVATA